MIFLGFPLSSVETEVKKEVTNLLEKCTDHSIAMVMCFCITLMMDELQQGLVFAFFTLPVTHIEKLSQFI